MCLATTEGPISVQLLKKANAHRVDSIVPEVKKTSGFNLSLRIKSVIRNDILEFSNLKTDVHALGCANQA